MNQPNKQRLKLWVDALRNAQFAQGTGSLASRKIDGTFEYCCLGVACEVAMANGLEVQTDMRGAFGTLKAYDGSDLTLPFTVVGWYGLSGKDPLLRDGLEDLASSLNDDFGWDFDQIANAIVTTYELEETNEPTQ